MDEEIKQLVLKMKEKGILRITYDFTVPNADVEVWFKVSDDNADYRRCITYPARDLD